ncbi:endocuticle structural glycoprotein ABD-5-like [Condylostylus longicornis]|uniref:endocuticle structural glycoprotein ABD-5-like n=1 Tax=Condylostylus longicornis TaxID=2530218 RepID=UPI00244E061A|nr:endocuticle structural glycoprotein ABD-5-like [Condylostylus longicornis]
MKLIIFGICLTLLINNMRAAPVDDSSNAQIVKYESENIGIGGYRFAYETSDGIARTETAELKNAGTDDEVLVVRGTISWVGPDGITYTIEFVADENGFQPRGDHLPK